MDKGKFSLLLLIASCASAQTLTTLANLPNGFGVALPAGLIQGTDGNFYGSTVYGGAYTYGMIFAVSPASMLSTVYNFCPSIGCADGAYPYAALVLGTDGNFYGTNAGGGARGWGTIFKITSSGVLTTLHSFCGSASCADGVYPTASLVQAANGNFYGTTQGDGTNTLGTIFRVTAAGQFTTLYTFCKVAGCPDGAAPTAGLIQATDGNFYGATKGGGIPGCGSATLQGCGTIFKVTAAGVLTTLHEFSVSDGIYPSGSLLQGTDGYLYGTTLYGGTYNYGTVFEITTSGSLTTLYSFCASDYPCADGYSPSGGLAQGTDGNFYGATESGGANYSGTLFSITPAGSLATLHTFNGSDGWGPAVSPVQGTDGSFYGTTVQTVYSLNMGLGPFIKTVPTSGKAGSIVTILGTSLSSATKVSFAGTAATFTVISPSEITANVPTGAKTGKVRVMLASGTSLVSNISFRVTK